MESPGDHVDRLYAQAAKLGDFSALSKEPHGPDFGLHSYHPNVPDGPGDINSIPAALSMGIDDVPSGPAPVSSKKNKKITTSSTQAPPARDKPFTNVEKKTWDKLVALASTRKDGAAIAAKIQQIHDYKDLFPHLIVEKINAETVSIEQLDAILSSIENQLAQPHTRKTARLQFKLVCKTLQKANDYFDLGLKLKSIDEVADARYKIVEPDWLEFLCKYRLLWSSRVELRMFQHLHETVTLSGQVDDGKIQIYRTMSRMEPPQGFSDLLN